MVKKFDGEFPDRYFKEFIQYLNIDESLFFDTIDKFRSPHLWGKDSKNNWELKHTVYNQQRQFKI